jgi:uncharacterized protein YndB with AHSA1/START domain
VPVNTIHVDTPPSAVYAVLADPDSYGHWVVGSSQIRDAEGGWPSEGATFHHTQGVWKVGIKDSTSVIDSEPNRRLILEVRARPLVVAKVKLELEADQAGTEVRMTEVPVRGLLGRLRNPVVDKAISLRNAQSLRRLRRLAEQRAGAEAGAVSA